MLYDYDLIYVAPKLALLSLTTLIPSSPLHHIHQTPLLIPPNHILLHPTDRPEHPRPNHAKQRRKQLPRINHHTQNPKLRRKLHKFVHLVEIVLRLDQVRGWGRMFLRHEVQDGDEGDVRGEERDQPDAEDLVYGDVEDQVLGIVCCG